MEKPQGNSISAGREKMFKKYLTDSLPTNVTCPAHFSDTEFNNSCRFGVLQSNVGENCRFT
jgi:hypothetical protein